MKALIDDNKLKDLMKQAIIETIEEKKDMVQGLLIEALEDVAMINAIKDGEDSGLAVLKILHEVTVHQEFCQRPS